MGAPIPPNEFERLIKLSELDLDYSNLEEHLDGLTNLAARILGTEVSLVNLIDSYTQWSVSDYGMDIQQMPREDSVCQYTILEEDALEIEDLAQDQRFSGKSYVEKEPRLKYYYGVPLKTSSGANIGALCVLDPEEKDITPEKKELLKLIGEQVVNRLEALTKIHNLEKKVEKLVQTHRKVSHDIRSPISGIIGIAGLLEEEVNENEDAEEISELVTLIKKGSNRLLELVEEIMNQKDVEKQLLVDNEFGCHRFCQKLNELYQPQAKAKGVDLNIHTSEESDKVSFSKKRLLQIVGNLITNSIKFTDEGGTVHVEITVVKTYREQDYNKLSIKVEDTGVGMSDEKIEEIMEGTAKSEDGTGGEKGYGFGLVLVHHLVQKANGRMEINSEREKGTSFLIQLPV